MISSALTGRFPYTSSRGMTYLFILYDYDSTAIIASPIKLRNAEDIVAGYEFCYRQLSAAGIIPILQRLNNEASTTLIKAITTKNLQYQLASPHNQHRLNPAERAIQTFKKHFISCLNGTDTWFPPHSWCRLIPQVVMTLNMLRTSRISPKLLAYSQLFGHFDYNKTPLAPLGTKVVIHKRPQQRRTFRDHGREGFYIGPAMQHYRHYSVFVTATRGDRVSNTVEFFPTKFTMPATSSNDPLAAAIEEITHIVQHPSQPAVPFLHNGERTNAMLAQLSEIFATATPQPSHAPTTAREAPRVQEAVAETATPPRVTATLTGTQAATPRVGLTLTTAPTSPRVQEPCKVPKALESNMQEGPYWATNNQLGQTRSKQSHSAGNTQTISTISKQQ
jgi:hypothetical protein